ncbi:MAG TPA: ribonuclease domain-containing protein [Mycobacteriales bacterium]
MLRTRRPLLALVVLAALLAGEYLLSAIRSDPARDAAAPTATATAGPTAGSADSLSTADGLRVVGASALPAEARRTLILIDRGGPFPNERDGAVFGNVERLLPQRPRGWYHEYTVPTPGEDDRGARRIVAGRDGTLYYTADHYESFVRVEPGL